MNVEPLLPESLDDGVTVVTATARLSRALREAHGRACALRGDTVWATPDVLPWSAWLTRCFSQLRAGGHASGAILSAAGRDAVWHEVVRADAGHRILSPRVAAASAAQAESLLLDHVEDADAVALEVTAETRAFSRWRESVATRCRALEYVDPARLSRVLRESAPALGALSRQKILVAGFDELPAAHRRLLSALEGTGIQVAIGKWRAVAAPAGIRVAAHADAATEVVAAAAWGRRLLESGAKGPVGVVVPDLDRRLEEVFDTFHDVFAGAGLEGAFHVSLGPALAGREMVADALAMLRAPLTAGQEDGLAIADAGRLLLSPYVKGAGVELGGRARLHAALLDTGYTVVPVSQLDGIAAQAAARDGRSSEGWSDALRAALAVEPPAVESPSGWARYMSLLLAAFGWPGERPLDSLEHQVLNAWNELLDGFAALDDVLARDLPYGEAVSLLSRMVASVVFAPRAQPAPVQVMGLLEAGGLCFEHLRVCGLDDDTWPPSARPTPFLPYSLQRSAGMPNSSPTLALERARRTTQSWLEAARGEIVLSYARREGDAQRGPSPLLAGIDVMPDSDPPDALLAFDRVRATAPLFEHIVDWRAPPLANNALASGGSGALKDYAACPFRAFAHRRLGANAPASRAMPPDPLARGLLLHDAVRRAWADIKSYETLMRITPQVLERIASDAVERALQPFIERHAGAVDEGVIDIERERSISLLKLWLEGERDRTRFEVLAHERNVDGTLGGLRFKLRIDRIDRLEDGRVLLVDYKTAKTLTPNAWLGERPEEPQLPVYALAWPEHAASTGEPRVVGGICYGQMHRANVGFKGIGPSDNLPPGARSQRPGAALKEAAGNWDGWLRRARVDLAALARGYACGNAVVDPRNMQRDCKQCNLQAFCRIAELAAEPVGDGAEADELDAPVPGGEGFAR